MFRFIVFVGLLVGALGASVPLAVDVSEVGAGVETIEVPIQGLPLRGIPVYPLSSGLNTQVSQIPFVYFRPRSPTQVVRPVGVTEGVSTVPVTQTRGEPLVPIQYGFGGGAGALRSHLGLLGLPNRVVDRPVNELVRPVNELVRPVNELVRPVNELVRPVGESVQRPVLPLGVSQESVVLPGQVRAEVPVNRVVPVQGEIPVVQGNVVNRFRGEVPLGGPGVPVVPVSGRSEVPVNTVPVPGLEVRQYSQDPSLYGAGVANNYNNPYGVYGYQTPQGLVLPYYYGTTVGYGYSTPAGSQILL